MKGTLGYKQLIDACDELCISRGTARELLRYLLARGFAERSIHLPQSLPPPLLSLLHHTLLHTDACKAVESLVGKIHYSDKQEKRLNEMTRLQIWLAALNDVAEAGWEPDLRIWGMEDVNQIQIVPTEGHRHGDEKPFAMHTRGPFGYQQIWRKVMPGKWQCLKLGIPQLMAKAIAEREEICANLTEALSHVKAGIPASAQWMTLFVKDLAGQINSLDVPVDKTIDDLKSLIRDNGGPSVDQQRLVFAGTQLEDGRKLNSYGIRSYCTLHLVLRLRGC